MPKRKPSSPVKMHVNADYSDATSNSSDSEVEGVAELLANHDLDEKMSPPSDMPANNPEYSYDFGPNEVRMSLTPSLNISQKKRSVENFLSRREDKENATRNVPPSFREQSPTRKERVIPGAPIKARRPGRFME